MDQLDIVLQDGKKIYFASDIHFGEPDYTTTRARERKVLKWIQTIEQDAAAIFFVGDVFDFWFEYKYVVPKGYIRFLGKLAQLIENGTPVYVFTGNHDLWMRDYLEEEIGVKIYRQKLLVRASDKRIFVAHGDGLGPGDTKFKLLKKVFQNRICQWLFRWLHPDIGIKIARLWSGRSREGHSLDKFKGAENEWLVKYSLRKLEEAHFDYFVFGHRHIPLEYDLDNSSKYINLGDWIFSNTFGEFDGRDLKLKKFETP